MKLQFAVVFLFLIFACSIESVSAQNTNAMSSEVTIHLNGKLAESACSVSTDSPDMHIFMGNYTPYSFEDVGAFSANEVPFTVNLGGCRSDVADGVRIIFSGITDPQEPDAFLVASVGNNIHDVYGNERNSGLGLIIYDRRGNKILPNTSPKASSHLKNKALQRHYIARYRETSRDVNLGRLRSEIWFLIYYP